MTRGTQKKTNDPREQEARRKGEEGQATANPASERREAIRLIWRNALQLEEIDTPLAGCMLGILQDGRIRRTVVGIEPEHCDPLIGALEQLIERLRQHKREAAASAGPCAEVFRISPSRKP